jgi:hypothetical protein
LKYFLKILTGTGMTWEEFSDGQVPFGAMEAGKSVDGESLYIGRGSVINSLTPGKIQQSKGCLYIGHGWHEHTLTEYEVLVLENCKLATRFLETCQQLFMIFSSFLSLSALIAQYQWTSISHPIQTPADAVEAGQTEHGANVFIGRILSTHANYLASIIPSNNIVTSYTAPSSETMEAEVLTV